MSNRYPLNLVLKKGDEKKLKGKLIAYATVDTDMDSEASAMDSMIRNGILAVKANYVDQRTIRDFFRSEFGVSLEKGIQEIIEQAKESGGLEGALDPGVVRDKLESMRNMEFIPIPAKVAFFQSENEMLSGDEDVYYLGHFRIVSHAHLCVNSFPILYQAKFREQEHQAVTQEIEEMLNTISDSSGQDNDSEAESHSSIKSFSGDIKEHLSKKLIPKMLYNINNKEEYVLAESKFKEFMADYAIPEDTEKIISLIKSNLQGDKQQLKILELMVDKIQALQAEDYEKLESINNEIKKYK
jgi:hypothetical protein